MSEEVKAPLGSAVEVSVDPEPEVVHDAPKRRGRGLDRSAMSADELKAHKKDIDQKHQRKQKTTTYVYDSKDEPTKPAALALLEERGLKHPHIQSTVYKLLLR